MGLALFGHEPDDTVDVEVRVSQLTPPKRFFRREPAKKVVDNLVDARQFMSLADHAKSTLNLAQSHPLLLLRVREAEERVVLLRRKRVSEAKRCEAKKKGRHGRCRDEEGHDGHDGGAAALEATVA